MNESDIELENEIFKMIYPLDRDIFKIICKIDRYKDKMPESLYNVIAKMHIDIYQAEAEKATEAYFRKRKTDRYKYLARNELFVPEKRKKRFFTHRNKAAKLIDEKIAQEWEEYLETAKKLLYKSDELATAGVNDLSDQVEPCNVAKTPPDLPITTLQACDELVKYAPPTPQNHLITEARGVDPNDNTPKTGKLKKEETKCKK